MKRKFKVGDFVRITDTYNKWNKDHSDEVYSIAGKLKVETAADVSDYALHRFSYECELDVYGIIEGDNGHASDTFAYRVYMFNELGEATTLIEPQNLERL